MFRLFPTKLSLFLAVVERSQPAPGRGPEHNQRIVAVLIDGLRCEAASPADVDASCGAYQAFGTVFEAHRRAQPNPALTKS